MIKKYSKDLINFLQHNPCSFLAIEHTKNTLKKQGFSCLNNINEWNIKENGKYYVERNDSTLIAFIVGKDAQKHGFKMIGSHTDSPSFMIKRNCEIKSENTLKLNTEGYGGMIAHTWLDRPLSIAGRVITKTKNSYPKARMVDFKKPIAIIPNLAIHLNRDINNGYKYSKQKELLPILSLAGEDFNEKGYLKKLLAKELSIDENDIIDYELFLYEAEKGSLVGINEEFISASRLDDLMMVYNSLMAFLKYEKESPHFGIKVLYLADNEEVGSHTGQGADGAFLRDTLKRLCLSLFKTEESFYAMAEKSTILSADLAHAIHPNYPEKHDITNKPKIGGGVCIKYSSNQKYSTTGIGTAIFDDLCSTAGIPYQSFINHSDNVGGSTIGAMLASQFNTVVIDFGVAVLGMHSIRELASVKDVYDCYKLFCTFYES